MLNPGRHLVVFYIVTSHDVSHAIGSAQSYGLGILSGAA